MEGGEAAAEGGPAVADQAAHAPQGAHLLHGLVVGHDQGDVRPPVGGLPGDPLAVPFVRARENLPAVGTEDPPPARRRPPPGWPRGR